MKTKILCILSLLCFCISQQVYSQDPVPEDYFDLFDPEPSEEKKGSEDKNPKPFNLDEIKNVLANTGAVGYFPVGAINSLKMVNDNCDSTYICMYNTLLKLFNIYGYEYVLNNQELECAREKEILQDYALFLLTLNLDLYCIEHLHPDGNILEDVELINAMLAMKDIFWKFTGPDYEIWGPKLPMLDKYTSVRSFANPFCSEDLFEDDDKDGNQSCDCGDFSGTLDLTKKNEILKDIRSIIDDINPMWQAAKAVKINTRLKALPCD